MRHDIYNNGFLRVRWDHESRIYTEWNTAGEETLSRPYTPEENAQADEEMAVFAIQTAEMEMERAALVSSAPDELAAVQQLTLQQQGVSDGTPWRQPQGAHDAYPLGFKVTHENKEWESLIPANVWAPGVSGWREVVAEGYPAWVQPTGAHDAYNIGDRVSFEGFNYESVIDANTWSPTAYPDGWVVI